MRKFVAVLAVLAIASVSFAQYSEDFEGEDITSLEALGWTFSPWGDPAQFVGIETSITHSGSQAISLPRNTRAVFPIDDFGTLDLWVYDAGVIVSGDTAHYGSHWGLAKDNNWIGASVGHYKYMDCAVAYAINLGDADNTLADSLFKMTWLDAGTTGDRSRGVAGWMHWEITFHEAGKIQIDLLEDANGCTSRRHAGPFESLPDGIGDAANDGAFSTAQAGGATALYLKGGSTPEELDPATPFFGNLIVDDITWTPAGATPDLHPGDANGDGTVNLDDFIILKQNYGNGYDIWPATWSQGNFNDDDVVNLDDFIILKQNYGWTAPE